MGALRSGDEGVRRRWRNHRAARRGCSRCPARSGVGRSLLPQRQDTRRAFAFHRLADRREEEMIRIAIPDDAPPVLASSAAWRELERQAEGRATLDYHDTLPGPEERLAERIATADAVLNIRSSSKFTAQVMERAP